MVASRAVDGADAAVMAAQELGFPVAMKGIAPHLPHKSDLGLVRLGLADSTGVIAAYEALASISEADHVNHGDYRNDRGLRQWHLTGWS